MVYLEAILEAIHETPEEWSEEYSRLSTKQAQLLETMAQTCGREMAEALQDVEDQLYFLACRDFFLHGLRVGLELLKL